MTHVLEWFRKQKLTNPEVKVRVYVASDEPRVLGECRKKYPDVEFLGDQDIARSAAVSSRYSDSSLRGVIQDIHLLSLTDHLVCTFSSQVQKYFKKGGIENMGISFLGLQNSLRDNATVSSRRQ